MLRYNDLAGTLGGAAAGVAPYKAAGGKMVAERMDEGLLLTHCRDFGVWIWGRLKGRSVG